jgi:universal stress protein A
MEAERVVDLVPQTLDLKKIHLKKILVPIDFSETSKKAFHYALRFAEQFNCEIVLLHVVEPVSPTLGPPLVLEVFLDAEDPLSIVEKKLAALSAQARTNGTNSASSTIRTGHAPNEITKAAKDLDVDLIVIATHGNTSSRYLCIGSTAERVVRSAPCPVLVVREKEHEFV